MGKVAKKVCPFWQLLEGGKMREPIHEFTKFENLKDMLKKSGEKFGDRPAYIYKTETPGKFREITHKEFREEVDALGTALINLGLKDKISIFFKLIFNFISIIYLFFNGMSSR